jgi:phage terminase small subunit
MALTAKQARFVAEYLIDLNATQAAIRAGYSARTAAEIGYELLRRPAVAAAIAEAQAARAQRMEITADRVVAELAKIGFANMADYMRVGADGDPVLDFSTLTRDQASALIEIAVDDYIDGRGGEARQVRRVRFKLVDKRAALVDLGRHLGIFKDKIEVITPAEEAERATEAREKIIAMLDRLAAASADERSESEVS